MKITKQPIIWKDILRVLTISIIINLVIAFGIKEIMLSQNSNGWTETSPITGKQKITIPIKNNYTIDQTYALLHETGHVVYHHFSAEQKIEWKTLYYTESFVSEYAMTNPNEDFAESWAFYTLHQPMPKNKKAFIEKLINEQIQQNS